MASPPSLATLATSPDPGLGRLRNTYGPASVGRLLVTHPIETLGLGGLAAILIVGGLLHGTPGTVVGGAAICAVVALGLIARRAAAVSVDVHEHGVVVRSRRGERSVRWTQIGDLQVCLLDLKTRAGTRIRDTLLLQVDDAPRIRLDHGIHGIRELIATIEAETSEPIRQRAQAALDAGRVFSFGALHLSRDGFVVHHRVVPWRDLERIESDDGDAWVTLASAGRHALGPYRAISSARALMRLAATRAAAAGRAVAIPGRFVATEGARRSR